jgi:hypothetical protein
MIRLEQGDCLEVMDRLISDEYLFTLAQRMINE